MAAAASTAPDRRADTSPTVRQAWLVEQGQAGGTESDQAASDHSRGTDFLQLDPASAPPSHLATWLATLGKAATYHAFQLKANKRFSKGLLIKGAYTWSKAIDMTDDDGWAALRPPLVALDSEARRAWLADVAASGVVVERDGAGPY